MPEFHRLIAEDHTTVRLYMDAIKRMGTLSPDLRHEAMAELMCFVLARDSALDRTDIGGHRMSEDSAFVERRCYHAILPRMIAMDPSDAYWDIMFDVVHSKVEAALMGEEMMVSLWRLDPAADARACEDYLARREAMLDSLRRSLRRSMPAMPHLLDKDLEHHQALHGSVAAAGMGYHA